MEKETKKTFEDLRFFEILDVIAINLGNEEVKRGVEMIIMYSSSAERGRMLSALSIALWELSVG